MKTHHVSKKTLIALSSSTLAAGMAHGSIAYTYVNQTIAAGNDNLTFDLNQDGQPDYYCAFDNNNASKPYINDSVGVAGATTSYVLSDSSDDNGASSQGLPLTVAGTMIDASYENVETAGYFYQDANGNVVGGWNSGGSDIDGYVGLELVDAGGNTHYGWAHFVYNSTTVLNGITGVLTLVDYAMETQPSTGIPAGETIYPGPPAFSIPPSSQTNAIGTTAQLIGIGIGNPTPTYQWMAGPVGSGIYTNLSDGGNISGSTSNTLTINNLSAANQEDYVLVLSNSNGSITNPIPATLTVVPLLAQPVSPSPVLLYTGSQATLTANYQSSVPVAFQWQKNGVNLQDSGDITGSSNTNLTFNSIALTDSGNYSVIITNIYGAVTSVVDSVTAFTPPTPYQQEIANLKPLTYYSFNETSNPADGGVIAFDFSGGLNGLYGTNTENGNTAFNITGPSPSGNFEGFASTNTALGIVSSSELESSMVTIPALNLNTNTATFIAWINPQQTEADYAVILSYRSAVSGTANGMNYDPNGGLGFHWNDQGSSYSFASGLVPPVGQWSMAALVVSATNAAIYLCTPQGIEVTNDVASNPVQAIANPGYIGGDTHDPNFIGDIDEVAIFNRSLTYTDITNIYNVAVTGTLPTPPPPTVNLSIQQSAGNLTISWTPVAGTLMEATSLSGPWSVVTTSSPYTAPISGAQMFFRVKVQ